MPRGVYQHPSRYTPEQRARGMQAMAVFGGNAAKAQRVLAEQGLEIPHSTLKQWKRTHEQEYLQHRERVLPRILANIAEGTDRIVDRATELELQALDRLEVVLPDLPDREVAPALRNVSTTKGINIQRGLEARGHPTSNPDHPAYDEIVNKLKKHGLVIEGEATEIDDQPALPTGQS